MLEEPLQARLKVLEDEVLRLSKLASQSTEKNEQDNYWRLAQDLQREARELRSAIRKISESPAAHATPEGETPPRNHYRIFSRSATCTLSCDQDHSRVLGG